MRNFIIRTIVFIAAVYIASKLISGISWSGWQALVLSGVALAILHSFIKPIIKIITLPINIITFGLFALVINAVFFWFVGNIIPGFTVLTFVAAFWGALVVSVGNWLFDKIIDRED